MPQLPDPRDRRAGWDDKTAPLPPLTPVRPAHPVATPPPLPSPYPAPSYAPGPVPPPRSPWTATRPARWRRVARVALPVLLLVAIIAGMLAAHRVYDFGAAISAQPPLSSQTGYVSGIGRVNLLVMGYGGGAHDGAYLTDSMMVLSLVPGNGATTLISVPRDLWVQVPPGSGSYAKLNTAYAEGLANGLDGLPPGKQAAGAEAAAKVSDVIGEPINYWLTLDFSGFRKLVDALGGVDLDVPTAFTANYPRNDDPAIDAGWKTIHFAKGPLHMDGERAIEYARARYVLDPPSEGSDFARSVRQQLLIRAILGRARQPSAWPGLSGATDALQGALYTNLSLADLALFAQKLDLSHAARVGLSDQNVLVNSQSSDGQDILQPANGDWGAVKQYVAQHLKS
jgi:LCP family protein required for cell wall assembly